MTTSRQSHPFAATSSPHYTSLTLNGTGMKNLGKSSFVLLLATLSGLWALASKTSAGRKPGGRVPESGPVDHPERGDVPGWVMITLMSAVLVAGLLALAGPALETMFNQAMDRVGK